jgi:hypothetical protein
MHIRFGGLPLVILSGLFAASPSSTSFTLKAYDMGGGGGTGSSATYKLNGVSGTQTGATNTSSTYNVRSGEVSAANSNVPPAPAFTNPSSYYDRLRLILNTGNNPSDTKYAIAISPDGFATTTQYVKSDHSTGSTLALADYQTYAAWGGASGFLILGLQQNTTYTVKVKAYQGSFSGSGFGPTATAATVQPQITFAVATTATATPPFTLSFTGLTLGTVFNAINDASISLTTNALSGGSVYLKGANGGLKSDSAAYTISSSSTDLSSAARGYGAVVTAVGQTSGGPFVSAAPFNGAGNNVGALTATLQQVAATTSPVTGGSLTVRLKAKTDLSVPEATDYTDTLTFIAAMSY